MSADDKISVTFISVDPDTGQPPTPVEALLKLSAKGLSLYSKMNKSGSSTPVLIRRWIPFRGPRFLQWLLTPFAAIRGMLFSWQDVQWIDDETPNPIMRIRPCVPSEFWVDLRFNNQSEAEAVRELCRTIGMSNHRTNLK